MNRGTRALPWLLACLALMAASLPDDAFDRARQARRAGRLDEAVTALRAALSADGADAESAGLLGLCLLDQGDLAAAQSLLDVHGSAGYRLGVLAGRLALQRGETEPAIELLQEVVGRDERPVEGLVTLLTALEGEARYASAVNWAEVLERHQPALGRRWGARMQEAVGDRILGRAARNVEALPRAADAYALAYEKDPELPGLAGKLLESLINAHRVDRAMALLPVVHPEQQQPIEYHLTRGRILAVAMDRVEAEKAFRLVLARAPGQRDASVELSRLLLAGGDAPGALALLEALAAGPPFDGEVELQRGLAREALGEWPAAETHLRHVVAAQSDHVEALYHLGRVLLRLGQVDEGRALIERSRTASRDAGG